MTTITILLLAHLVADFPLQSNKIVRMKNQGNKGLGIHVAVHVVVLLLLIKDPLQYWPAILVPISSQIGPKCAKKPNSKRRDFLLTNSFTFSPWSFWRNSWSIPKPVFPSGFYHRLSFWPWVPPCWHWSGLSPMIFLARKPIPSPIICNGHAIIYIQFHAIWA